MLLQEQMEDVGKLKQWLKRKEKIKYLSPAITNEILYDFSRDLTTLLLSLRYIERPLSTNKQK